MLPSQIIPYIASQFRKDKIWLRRTKPSKRQYQVVVAIDNSRSMRCGIGWGFGEPGEYGEISMHLFVVVDRRRLSTYSFSTESMQKHARYVGHMKSSNLCCHLSPLRTGTPLPAPWPAKHWQPFARLWPNWRCVCAEW